MLDIKVFNDGDRKVVVFSGDNVTDIPDNIILQRLLSVFNNADIATVPDNKSVEPIETVKPDVTEVIAATPVENAKTEEKPEQIATDYVATVSTGDQKADYEAFRGLCDKRKDKNLSKEEKHNINLAIKAYCNNRFKDCDAEQYANKLTDKQLINFVDSFGELVPSISYNKEDKETLKRAVVEMITKFKA